MAWVQLVDIGHTAIMVPTAGALAAWMMAGRAWKMALWWCLMFGAGLAVVALSKVGYLGWQIGIPSVAFQALSGHSLRATAVLPVCCFLVLQGAPERLKKAGVVCGVCAALCIAAMLVRFRFHTLSEVLGSSVLGLLISIGFIRIAATLPEPRVNLRTAALSLLVFIGIAGLRPATLNHRLVDVALYLSGREQPYLWSRHASGVYPPAHRLCEEKASRASEAAQ